MASSTINLKAAGLQTSANRLDLPEGSMSEASNIIIKRDGIVEQRRGFKLFGNVLNSVSDRVLQLAVYRDRIIRHDDAHTLQFQATIGGVFEDYLNSVIETQTGLRIKFIESNGNLYFTTSEGIKKLSAKNAGQLDEIQPQPAGAIKALDLDAVIRYTANAQTGFLPQDSAVAYRVVWNKKDNNNNLITGAPSQRAVVYNPMTPLMLQDYVRILNVLDNLVNSSLTTARINDDDYVSTLLLGISASPSELRTNLIALATKLDNDIFYADQAAVAPLQISSASITTGICTITLTGTVTNYLTAGSLIKLSGFSAAIGTLETDVVVNSTTATKIIFNTTASGIVTISSGQIRSNIFRDLVEPSEPNIPATNADLVEIQDYMDGIILNLQELNTFIINSGADADAVATLDITTTATVDLSFTIPEEILTDTAYFYQIYRSAIAQAVDATVLADISPNDELQLVYEDYPTPAQLAVLQIEIEDVTPEDFRGANLYTNASTGEGIANSNDQPPFAKDINRYRNSVFYSNTRTKQRLSLNLLGVQKMIDDYDLGDTPKITITNGTITNTYEFVTGQQEITTIEPVADVANSLNSKYFLLPAKTGNNLAPYIETTTAVAPVVAGYTAVKIKVATGATAATIKAKMADVLAAYIKDFVVTIVGNTVEVVNVDVGELTDAVDVDTGFTIVKTQEGRGEKIQEEITKVTAVAGSLYVSSGTADYFTINTALNQNRYLVWFQRGTATAPIVAGKTNLEVVVTGSETNADMAIKIAAVLPTSHFETSIVSNVLTVTNIQYGSCDNATEVVSNAGFLVSTEQEGALQILLSPLVSPARAVEATSSSIVRVINKNLGDLVYAYYLSGALDVPGKFLLEGRSLQDVAPFYVVANNDNTGSSFSPVISPETQITAIATGATSSVITTAEAHGMINGDDVVITSTNSNPIVDGLYEITYISSTSFSIPTYVSVAGTEGAISRASVTLVSENEEKSNRVYFSKFQQPEAVPIINYFDVGSQDKQILRIVPLRDSLFVFKEDGLYRISGDSAPFQLELFDNSFILLAPDSVAVCNNVIYAWTTQGIQSLSEGGSEIISRDIDNIILQIQSANYTNFKTVTWGVGYESDNSYIVYTVVERDDEVAQIAYRYSTITKTWTTYDKTNSCGVINSFDDKLYLGCTDVAYIEQERKTFDRTDYADREIISTIGSGTVLNDKLILPLVTQFAIGDVIRQYQTVTVYNFNAILEKLDIDTGIATPNFFSTLEMERGDSARNKLIALATKLDTAGLEQTDYLDAIDDKTGSITSIVDLSGVTIITSAAHDLITGRVVTIIGTDSTPTINSDYQVTVLSADTFSIDAPIRLPGTTGTWSTNGANFQDCQACFNELVSMLNADTTINFNNYRAITHTTIQETIITAINKVTRQLTLNLSLDYITGEIIVYKAIVSNFTYSPNTMGDPLMQKHLSEATIMFDTRTLTNAMIEFATDLLPQFIPVSFTLDGNGIFGHSPAFGGGFFGGLSNSAPFRTYVPRQCMRCRYIVVRFSHSVAMEDYRILGITITGNIGISTRTYR